jgi:N-glycosylase/DNA lyase
VEELHEAVRPARFYRNKTKYLLEAKAKFPEILSVVRGDKSDIEKRDWLVKNVKGLGMKASSHFMRNLGARDLAIIDVHVLKFLKADLPVNRKEYVALEDRFRKEAKKRKLTPCGLDIVIWQEYSQTPWEEFVY